MAIINNNNNKKIDKKNNNDNNSNIINTITIITVLPAAEITINKLVLVSKHSKLHSKHSGFGVGEY